MSSTTATAVIDHHHDPSTSTGIPNKKLLLWAFLASDCMFFACLISTHLVYRLYPPPGSPDPRHLFEIQLTSFSTFILLMSSLMMALAVNAIQKNNLKSTRWSLLTTAFFGTIFLGCQVFEFEGFVKDGMTISNSLFGSTFYTLVGTHGCHVAVGVLWLLIMYVRTFLPKDTARDPGWFFRGVVHTVALVGTALCGLFTVVNCAQLLGAGAGLGALFTQHFGLLIGLVVCLGVSAFLGRPRGAVAFDESNAIDVESMGLYWHFVDIVWIIIFTAVYLLEFI